MFFFVAKLVLDGAAGGALLLMAMILLSPIFFVGYVLCSIFFGFNLVRAYLKGSSLGRKQGWHKRKKKHLLAIGTLPSEQGKGYGSQLLKAVFLELEAEKYYGGYHLESSNPRNVAFYERNQFVNLGAVQLSGMTVTLLVRPDLYRPPPSGVIGPEAPVLRAVPA